MKESLKQKKHEINNIECTGLKLNSTNEEHFCQMVGHLNSDWAALETKVHLMNTALICNYLH